MTTKARLTKDDLAQFTGSERWFRSAMNPKLLYTEGAQYVAEAGQAYWLLDEIALAQRFVKSVAKTRFQVWTLKVGTDRTAILRCEDGNGKQVYAHTIAFTDFPLDEISLWFAHNVVYLPGEH